LYKRQARTSSRWKKIIRIGGGSLLIALGAVMLVTPGPGLVLIPAGLLMVASVHPPLHHWLSVRRRWLGQRWRRWRARRKRASQSCG
jgi:hypothetical protein